MVLEDLYKWIDQVNLSKPKRNIMRDFSDCSLVAEILKFYLPIQLKSIIQVHNYVQTMNS